MHFDLTPISAGILTDRMFYADGGGGAAGATLAFHALAADGSNNLIGVDTGTGNLTSTCSTAHYAPDYAGVYQQYAVNTAVESGGGGGSDDVYLQYYPAATNSTLNSYNLTTGWIDKTGTLSPLQDQDGLDGAANNATELTRNTTVSQQYMEESTAPAYGAGVYKIYAKTAGGAWLHILKAGGNDYLQFDIGGVVVGSNTGGAGIVASEIISSGNGWVICLVEFSSAANRVRLYPFGGEPSNTSGPADGLAGSVVIGNIEWHNAKTIAEVRGLAPIFTTTGSVTTVKIDPISVDAANHSDTDGLYYLEWTPSYATADATGNQVILSLDGADGLLYYDATAGAFKSTDGINTVSVTKTIVADTTYKLFLLYHATEAKMQISVDSTDGTEGTYDGGFVTTGALEFAGGGTYANKARDWRRYDIDSMAEGATQRDSLK